MSADVRKDWKALATIFDNLLGGSALSQQAAAYLRGLANGTLPQNPILPLPWHSSPAPPQLLHIAREEPHPVVLAALSPSVPLRAVWKRGR